MVPLPFLYSRRHLAPHLSFLLKFSSFNPTFKGVFWCSSISIEVSGRRGYFDAKLMFGHHFMSWLPTRRNTTRMVEGEAEM
ncbi:hypothetical protein F511_36129 [Dorcoceras hygrometricum]|uniref:Uncharacterized protein n=1 Tax=Dorcoceras hygrometricum TaxID=472368 RepID=A0A2Z7CM75_9LAMI|nr:hypothetical protein F511_36129 [Dorcoceras hygrometricum]